MTSASDDSVIRGIAIGNNGSIYVVGHIVSGTYSLGNGITVSGPTSSSYNDIFIAKYDTNGGPLWAKSATIGFDTSELHDVAVDSSGNAYAVGFIKSTNTYAFGSGITAAGSSSSDNIVIIKYNTSGVAQWAKTVSGSTKLSHLYGVALDKSGNPYTVGNIRETTAYNLGNGVTVTGGSAGYSTLVAKYNPAGNAQWAEATTSAPTSSTLSAVALDNDNNIFSSGYLEGSGVYKFGNGVNVTAQYSGFNGVLLKYNSTGHAQWARSPVTAPDSSSFGGVTVDSLGNSYAAGYITDTDQFNFGNNVTAKGGSASSINMVLVSYDDSGNPMLAKTVQSGAGSSRFFGITISNSTADGDIYAGGVIVGDSLYNLENNVTVSGSNTGGNAIIVKYHGNYTDSESSSYPSSSSSSNNTIISSSSSSNNNSSSSSSKQPIASSSSSASSNPSVVSKASLLKPGIPKLFAISGGVVLLLL